jgi:hypothetical protein
MGENEAQRGSLKHASSGAVVIDKPRTRQPWDAYVLGALLTYSVCILFGGSMFSNRLGPIVEVGSVMGIFFFFIAGPIHWLLQYITHSIFVAIKGPKGRSELFLLNCPIALVLLLSWGALILESPAGLRRKLQEQIESPLPASIEVKGYLRRGGLDAESHWFVLSGSSNDLATLISAGGYTQDVSRASVERDARYPTQAREVSGSQTTFSGPVTVYEVNKDSGTSHNIRQLVIASNGVDAIYFKGFY